MGSVFQRALILLLLLSTVSLFRALPANAVAQSQSVKIAFTARGKDKRFFPGIRKEDIRLLDDGAPQEIVKLEQQADSPIAVIILIDTSLSQGNALSVAKRAARAFLDSIIRPEKDLAAVISFAGEATLEQSLTSDLERLRSRINNIRPELGDPSGALDPRIAGGTRDAQTLAYSTSIWDAVWVASSDAFTQDTGKMRRAIILLSDGLDTTSRKKMSEAIEQAIESRVAVFAIAAGSVEYGFDRGSLRKIAERTGGQAFFPKDLTNLPPILAEIEQELRSQYLVTYLPASGAGGGKMRKVKIEIVNPELRKQDLRLSYQQGYFR
ncbi:MAG TPA: VWA domain-containing protein [Pyrinomonadaceae bacterium]|jgi:VWFA-related protein